VAVVIDADENVAEMAGQAARGRRFGRLQRGLIVQLLPFSRGFFFFFFLKFPDLPNGNQAGK
jgi:hypothetical protein